MFQSIDDSFRVQVPSSWVIQDVNNTGLAFFEESRQGYAILAQLCPEQEEEQQQLGAPTISNNTVVGGSISNCQQAQDVIHIIRYPNLETGTQLASNNITAYHLQKLQEVGYRDIRILTSTDTTVNVTNPQTGETVIAAPAKFVEATYSTNFAPNQIRSGNFVLTATNVTAPNVGITKGYSVFYEGSSNSAASTEGIMTSPTTTSPLSSGLLPPTPPPLPQAVAHVLSSFELIVAPQVAEQATVITEQTVQGGGFGQVIQSECDPSYPNVCILPPPPNLNCDDIDARNFTVLSPDPHNFDRNSDGIGCENGNDAPDDPGDNGGDGGDNNGGDTSCHPSYPDECIPPPPPNLNCDDVDATNFAVSGSDPHGFDGDNDGIGCESDSDAPDDPGEEPGGGEDDDGDGGDDGDGDDNGGNEEPEPEPGGGEGDGDNEEGDGGEGDGGEGETPPGGAGGAPA